MFRRKLPEPEAQPAAFKVMRYDPPARAAARRLEPAPDRPSAVAVMLGDQFAAREWRGSGTGARIVPRRDAQPPPQPVWRPPPRPDWVEEERLRAERDAALPQPEPPPTIVDIMLADGQIEWPTVGPPLHTEPLAPLRFPEPDWRAEQRQVEARQEREKIEHARALLGLDEETPRPDYPASKRTALPVLEPEPGQLRPRVPRPPWVDGAA